MKYIVGVDIGGTFTDCVAMDEQGAVTLGKALSTPDDFAVGAVNAVIDAAHNLGLANEKELLSATKPFFHACTVADNTLAHWLAAVPSRSLSLYYGRSPTMRMSGHWRILSGNSIRPSI